MQWTWAGWVWVCDRTPWRTVRLDSCWTELSQSGCNLNQKIQKHIFFINNKLKTAYKFGNWSNIILHSNIFKLAHFRRLFVFLFSFQLQNQKNIVRGLSPSEKIPWIRYCPWDKRFSGNKEKKIRWQWQWRLSDCFESFWKVTLLRLSKKQYCCSPTRIF